jgi:molybdopterin-guanine dinucleotide biosynthesis protein A
MTAETDTDAERNEGVSGIVLAGGASKRFGSDKLVATIEGRPILQLAIDAVGAVSAEVLVVLAPADARDLPATAGPKNAPVRRIEDPESFGGPLVGLLAGLEQSREPLALVAGGDMPSLSVDVLRALLHELTRSDTVEAAVLVRQSVGRPLPAALRNGSATQAARRLLGQDERRLRALLRELRTSEIREADWRSLDPSGDTLRDVDTPEDLRG